MFFNLVFHSCFLKICTCFFSVSDLSFYSLSHALICNLFKYNKSPRLRTFAKNLKSILFLDLRILLQKILKVYFF